MTDDDDKVARSSILAGFVFGNLVGGSGLLFCGIILGSAPFIILGVIGFLLAVVFIYVS